MAVPAWAADPPPLAAYGNLPDIETMALSNDGSRIAAVMTIKGERVVVLMSDKLQTIRMMRLQDAKVRSLDWVGNDALVVEMSRTEILGPEYIGSSKFEFWHAIVIPADAAKDPILVFDKDPVMLNAIFGSAGTRKIDGRWLVYFAGVERERGARGYALTSGRPALFAIDPLTGHRNKIADRGSQGQGTGWLLSRDGKVAATFSIDILRGSWQIDAPGGLELASGVATRGGAGLVALGKDGRSIIYRELDESEGRTKWKEVSLDGRSGISQFAYEDEMSRLFTDRLNGELIGYLRMGRRERPHFYDPAKQAVVEQIYKAFPNLNVRMVDWTPDFSRVLVRTDGNADSGTWYLVDMATMHAEAIGYERVAIGPEWVGNISTVAYKAKDGLDLDGILSLPPGREPKNLPVVVLPHGGPHAYDDESFDWWAQAFASRGYAVFQPNFRGSTNRDETFMRAGFGQWGKAMQTDISDGLEELARRGIVDRKRACIMGGSYGGYAALAGVTLQHGLYRCAVSVAGVSDVGDLFSSEKFDKGAAGFVRRSRLEEFGAKSGFDDISPRHFANQADAPILLIHGRDDTVVPFNQSCAMADSLKDAGKRYQFEVLKGEDHWLSRSDTRQQMLEAAVAFVQKYNPPD
uniref:alpha/beta hydrolase family protein n=1 Tax=Altererythrobacter segetis TaxID=1104773 RepID=UPI001FAF3B0E|nr:alpha/beta fold hydrolase [Altererythrobacter segetis]